MGTRNELLEIFATGSCEHLDSYLEGASSREILSDIHGVVERFATGDKDVRRIEKKLGAGWVKHLADSLDPPV